MSYYVIEHKKGEMFMCFHKRCDYSGIGISYGGQRFADICPKCKLKNSYVQFTDLFRSSSVEEPNYFRLNNVDYLVTTGTGVINNNSNELQGVYTLILSDAATQPDRFIFEFFSVDTSGCGVSVIISCIADIKIKKCSRCIFKRKPRNTQIKEQLNALKNPLDAHSGCYAKKVIFYPNGRVEEIDLIHYFRCYK